MAKSPSHGGEMEGFYLIFWLRNYPHATGTRPDVEYCLKRDEIHTEQRGSSGP